MTGIEMKRMNRVFYVVLSAIVCLSCNISKDSPPENATPEFTEVKYEAGRAEKTCFAELSASLTTDNGVSLSGFMLGRDEVHLKFYEAKVEDCSFSIRVDNLEGATDYCFYARAGNGRNEIRTGLVRFKTESLESGGASSDPDNPGIPEEPETPIMPPDGVGITVSDPEFLKLLLSLYDSNSDGKIVSEEADRAVSITVCTDNILSLDGVQYFRALKDLDCCGSVWNGQLTSLAVGSNAGLQTLKCSYNHLTSISLPSSLREMECRFNNFRSLNLREAVQLRSLDCFGNGLEELDLSGLKELESLVAGMNSFKILDVSGNPKLKLLDLSDSPDLEIVYVAKGQKINELIVDNNVKIKYKE